MWYVAVAGIIGLLVFALRAKEFYTQRKIIMRFKEEGNPFEFKSFAGKRFYIYAGMVALITIMIILMDDTILTKLGLVVTFSFLLGGEMFNTFTMYRVYFTHREFLYGTDVMRYKTIRSFKEKSKRYMDIVGLNGVTLVLPKDAAEFVRSKSKEKK